MTLILTRTVPEAILHVLLIFSWHGYFSSVHRYVRPAILSDQHLLIVLNLPNPFAFAFAVRCYDTCYLPNHVSPMCQRNMID